MFEEVAPAYLYLTQSEFMTGETIDGGQRLIWPTSAPAPQLRCRSASTITANAGESCRRLG